jgi:hypothetical protein
MFRRPQGAHYSVMFRLPRDTPPLFPFSASLRRERTRECRVAAAATAAAAAAAGYIYIHIKGELHILNVLHINNRPLKTILLLPN